MISDAPSFKYKAVTVYGSDELMIKGSRVLSEEFKGLDRACGSVQACMCRGTPIPTPTPPCRWVGVPIHITPRPF